GREQIVRMRLAPPIRIIGRIDQRHYAHVRNEWILNSGQQNRLPVVPLVERTKAFPPQTGGYRQLAIHDESVAYVISLVQFESRRRNILRERTRRAIPKQE